MAKNNDSKRNPSAPSRVYKSSDVHKRRVNRKDQKKTAEASREVEAKREASFQREGRVRQEVPSRREIEARQEASPQRELETRREAPVPQESRVRRDKPTPRKRRKPNKAETHQHQVAPQTIRAPREEMPVSEELLVEEPFAEENSGRPAVVITPQFGGKTDAERAADERWFAAMREENPAGEEQRAFESAEHKEATAPASAANAKSDLPVNPANVGSDSLASAANVGSDSPANAANVESDSAAVQNNVPFNQRPTERIESRATEAAGLAAQVAQAAGAAAGTEAAEASPDATVAMPVVPPITGAETEQVAEEKPESKRAKFVKRVSSVIPSSRKMRVAIIAGSLAFILAIVLVSLFAWNRWYRFDDHADMQGEWYVVGSTVPVMIDETSIHLTDDVTYQYEINDHDKTISYTFGPMAGQGRYWFSDDRKYLVITDGDSFTGENTAFDDLMHMFADLPDKVSGSNIKLPEGEGIIAFSREPDPQAVAKKQEEEKAKAEAEEAARKEEERRAAEEAAEAEAYYSYEEEVVEETPAETPPAQETPAETPPAEEAPAEGSAEG